MRILVVNPNTSASMTEQIRASAVAAAPPDVSITTVCALRGPEEIKSPAMAAAQAPVVIETIAANAHGVDAAIIAAFSDPGLDLARARFSFPVVGIAEALFVAAASIGRFVLVVHEPGNRATYAKHIETYGVANSLIGIRYVVPALPEGRHDPDTVKATLLHLIRAAIDEDGAQAIAIGSGALAGFGASVAASVSVPVFESVSAAVHLAVQRVRKRADGGSR